MATCWLTYSASASDDLLAYPVLTVMLIIHQLCITNLSEYQWKHSQIVKAALAVILQFAINQIALMLQCYYRNYYPLLLSVIHQGLLKRVNTRPSKSF